jgi:hypothetical protein
MPSEAYEKGNSGWETRPRNISIEVIAAFRIFAASRGFPPCEQTCAETDYTTITEHPEMTICSTRRSAGVLTISLPYVGVWQQHAPRHSFEELPVHKAAITPREALPFTG